MSSEANRGAGHGPSPGPSGPGHPVGPGHPGHSHPGPGHPGPGHPGQGHPDHSHSAQGDVAHSHPGNDRLGDRQSSGTGVMAAGLGRRMAIAGLAAALVWLAVAWALAS